MSHTPRRPVSRGTAPSLRSGSGLVGFGVTLRNGNGCAGVPLRQGHPRSGGNRLTLVASPRRDILLHSALSGTCTTSVTRFAQRHQCRPCSGSGGVCATVRSRTPPRLKIRLRPDRQRMPVSDRMEPPGRGTTEGRRLKKSRGCTDRCANHRDSRLAIVLPLRSVRTSGCDGPRIASTSPGLGVDSRSRRMNRSPAQSEISEVPANRRDESNTWRRPKAMDPAATIASELSVGSGTGDGNGPSNAIRYAPSLVRGGKAACCSIASGSRENSEESLALPER